LRARKRDIIGQKRVKHEPDKQWFNADEIGLKAGEKEYGSKINGIARVKQKVADRSLARQ